MDLPCLYAALLCFMSEALQFSLHIVLLQYGSTVALSQCVQKHAEAIRTGYMLKHTIFMSGYCMQRPAASTLAFAFGL